MVSIDGSSLHAMSPREENRRTSSASLCSGGHSRHRPFCHVVMVEGGGEAAAQRLSEKHTSTVHCRADAHHRKRQLPGR